MWGIFRIFALSIRNLGTMKITLIIKKSVKRYDTESKATIYARLRDGRQVDMVAPTRLTINPNLWDDKAEQVKSKIVCNDEMRSYYNDEARKLKSYLEKAYQSRQTTEPQKEWLKETLEQYYNPQKYNIETATEETAKPTLIALFDEFLEKHRLSDVRKKNYRVIKRGLQRYELYIRTTKRGQKAFVLDIDQVTADTLRDIWEFLENEYRYCALYPEIYEAIPEARTPQPRGKNTLLDCFSRIRTFFYWCNSNKKTRNRPFDDFPLEECTYGTPYYITVEELHKIYGTNLMRHPQLAVQRDIFVFQCLIGCRVGDRRSHRVHTAQDQGRATADRAGSAESDSQRDRSPLQRSGRRQTAAVHLRAEIQSGDQADFQSRRIEAVGYGHKPHHPRRRKKGTLRDRLVASGPPDIRRKSV